PRPLDLGVGLAERLPGGGGITASVARRNIRRMAEQFIVGTGPADAVNGLHRLWKQGSGFVVDLLGEKTVTETEADRYAGRVVDPDQTHRRPARQGRLLGRRDDPLARGWLAGAGLRAQGRDRHQLRTMCALTA